MSLLLVHLLQSQSREHRCKEEWDCGLDTLSEQFGCCFGFASLLKESTKHIPGLGLLAGSSALQD